MKTTKQNRVLVLDGDMVPALTIARSLRNRGCEVDICSTTRRPLAGYSRSVSESYEHPDPLTEEARFIDWLHMHTQSKRYSLVVPVTERSLVPISRHRARFEHVRVAMPSQKSLELALDKEQTVALARQVNVPVPEGVTVSSLDELPGLLPSLQYPVVLKPARSLGTDKSGSSQLKVSYAFDSAEVRAGCEHGLRFGPVLLQEYFRGEGVGIELIAKAGKILYSFQHLRLHEVPLTGGGSSLRKSQVVEPVLLEAAERLVAALEWDGVAMVEFKWNAGTRKFTLMEINGRFWGSLPLADAAGADFPSMLLDLELEGTLQSMQPYRPDVYCRKLSSDLYWYEAVMRGGEDPRIVELPSRREIIRELGLLFSLRHYFDVQSLRDPLPGLVDIGEVFVSYFHRLSALAREKWFLWRQRRAWRRGDVSRALANAEQILFVCYGNINRSALAENLIRGYAEDVGVAVVSAGFHQVEGRPADPVMVDVARSRGRDLTSSSSIALSTELLERSDVIFVMESEHMDRLKQWDDGCATRAWLLGAHSAGGRFGTEIADPYGKSRGLYERCYDQVAVAVDQIKSVLALRQVG